MDYNNRTPLHIAAANGRYAMVDYLLTVGAHVHTHDQFGYTPLRDAVEKRYPKIIQLLRADGAQLGMPPSEVAAKLCTLAAQVWGRRGRAGTLTRQTLAPPLPRTKTRN